MHLAGGRLEAHIDVQRGRIEAIEIGGDFARRAAVAEVVQGLIGTAYSRQAIVAALAGSWQAGPAGDLNQDTLLELIY
jgi:hypothetical protein